MLIRVVKGIFKGHKATDCIFLYLNDIDSYIKMKCRARNVGEMSELEVIDEALRVRAGLLAADTVK